MKTIKHNFTRRKFIATAGTAAAAFTIVPRNVLGGSGYQPPSDMINVAGVGIANHGFGNLRQIQTPDGDYTPRQRPGAIAGVTNAEAPAQETVNLANIYCLCDVDDVYAGPVYAAYPKAKKYYDYREMLDKEPEIDAVYIGTPDHHHALVTARALRLGKHVHCEKPLGKSIYETRVCRQLAREAKVTTTLGNQGHFDEGSYRTLEWIQSGALGDITDVYYASRTPSWPCGDIQRPEGVPVPETLKYDLWLGPAPEKPYHPDTTHFNWRGLWDYGTGIMGDFGIHLMDNAVRALKLGSPIRIQASSGPYNDEYYPVTEKIRWDFPARGNMPPVSLHWYDGGIKPDIPPELPPNVNWQEMMWRGTSGAIMLGARFAEPPQVYPQSVADNPPPQTIPRPGPINTAWINAIKNGEDTTNNFEHSGLVSEISLLGLIAIAMQRHSTPLLYDGEKITNITEANDLFQYEYRQGWTL
jgi:hypothetical protein